MKRVYVVFQRKTSTVSKAFRFEVPLIKARFRHPLSLQVIPESQMTKDDSREFTAESAMQFLRANYPDVCAEVYPDLETFRPDFEACAQRDGGQVDAKTGGWEDLLDIDRVGEELAQALHASGFSTIQQVAEADVDALEAVPGIGPSSAIVIRRDAIRLVEDSLTDPEG